MCEPTVRMLNVQRPCSVWNSNPVATPLAANDEGDAPKLDRETSSLSLHGTWQRWCSLRNSSSGMWIVQCTRGSIRTKWKIWPRSIRVAMVKRWDNWFHTQEFFLCSCNLTVVCPLQSVVVHRLEFSRCLCCSSGNERGASRAWTSRVDGWNLRARLRMDSSAGRPVRWQASVGRIRHLEMQESWALDETHSGRVVIERHFDTVDTSTQLQLFFYCARVFGEFWHEMLERNMELKTCLKSSGICLSFDFDHLFLWKCVLSYLCEIFAFFPIWNEENDAKNKINWKRRSV